MTFADAKLLREFARLQLRIAQSKAAPLDRFSITEDEITRSKGYRDLRDWWVALSPQAKVKGRRVFQAQIDAVRDVVAQAAKTGEELSLADLEIVIRDVDALPVPALTRCPGSNRGIAEPTNERIACGHCKATWHVDDIGFKIPEHEEQT